MSSEKLIRFFETLASQSEAALLLGGDMQPGPLNRWIIMGLHPVQRLRLMGGQLWVNDRCHTLETAEQLFELLEACRAQAQIWPAEKRARGLPMAGGLAGALAYPFYHWCDPAWRQAPCVGDDAPQLVLYEFADWLFYDLTQARWTILSTDEGRKKAYLECWESLSEVEPATPPWPSSDEDFRQTLQASLNAEPFEAAVLQLKEAIAVGEVYQANLSIRLQKELTVNPFVLYQQLCQRNPSPFAGLLKVDDGSWILSNSPERLIQMDETARMQARPIAGTRGRGATPEADLQVGESLLTNQKERAEHLMLVDLIRHDLGRACQAGTVEVDELLVLERYSHVTHLVSNVRGQKLPQLTQWEVLQSLFPGGTITGCPKLRCMEILNTLEPVSRGFYTGSLGYMDAASMAMDWNILIRSLFLSPVEFAELPLRYNAAMHVGAGIVHDSVPAHEYRECMRKAEAILSVLQVQESSVATI